VAHQGKKCLKKKGGGHQKKEETPTQRFCEGEQKKKETAKKGGGCIDGGSCERKAKSASKRGNPFLKGHIWGREKG